ncbi:hypothetical protein AGLY_013097 [Aphis glycines]|uniref:Uncharacterized protein n=1 Tax=Aphis glycines TaxID=307491 RepID=A0A6G0T8C6_APHGL|nr:hypothetical protein AGLY_013097 [Aphis glycines]
MENQRFHSGGFDVRSKAFFHLHSYNLNFDHRAIRPYRMHMCFLFLTNHCLPLNATSRKLEAEIFPCIVGSLFSITRLLAVKLTSPNTSLFSKVNDPCKECLLFVVTTAMSLKDSYYVARERNPLRQTEMRDDVCAFYQYLASNIGEYFIVSESTCSHLTPVLKMCWEPSIYLISMVFCSSESTNVPCRILLVYYVSISVDKRGVSID